jgi:hypothetical protein
MVASAVIAPKAEIRKATPLPTFRSHGTLGLMSLERRYADTHT